MIKVIPISSAYKPRLRKAAISVRFWGGKTEHAVIELDSGKRHILPEEEAWKLHHRLNMEV